MNQSDPRVRKTLKKLDQSLIENLNSYAFQNITVNMICRKAKVNRSTFYKYYKNKNNLLDNYLRRILEGFKDAISSTGCILASPYTVSGSSYMKSFEKTIDYIQEHLDDYRVLWKASIGRSVYTEMENMIRTTILRTAPTDSSHLKAEPCGREEANQTSQSEPCGCEEANQTSQSESCGCEEANQTSQSEPCGCEENDPEKEQIKMQCYHELYAGLFAANFMTLIRWWLSKQPSISRDDVMSVMEGSIRKGFLKTLPYAKDL